MKQAKSDKAG